MDDVILQGRLANQDNAISNLSQSQQLLVARADNIDAYCSRYDDYIPNIDYCFEAISAYVKSLVIKLLNIGIDYRTDCNYVITGNHIALDITYYVSGNTLSVKVNNDEISYDVRSILIYKLLENPGWENIILCDIRGLLNRFNTINS